MEALAKGARAFSPASRKIENPSMGIRFALVAVRNIKKSLHLNTPSVGCVIGEAQKASLRESEQTN